MARILVTGSAQGIGAETARALISLGHDVTVHGRSQQRADAALAQAPGATGVVVGDFASLASVRTLAEQANAAGPFDVVIHNVGLGPDQPARVDTVDGHEQMLQINVIAPYLLTCLMPVAPRMVYIGSDAHRQGDVRLDDLEWRSRPWEGDPWPGLPAYSDSKLLFQLWVFELAARVPGSAINVVHPGWVQTAMGGPNAAIPVAEGADTPVWMATSDHPLALGSGAFVHLRAAEHVHPASLDPTQRASVVARLEDLTGEALPSA